ncbi:MAG: hypothetical protein JXR05_16030 [Flavobacteriaceae bacterium]
MPPPPVPPPPPPGLPIDNGVIALFIVAVIYGSLIMWNHTKNKNIKTSTKSNNLFTNR